INFDSQRWFGLPSYYVQAMFANNQGTVTLPVKIENAPTFTAPYASGRIGLGTWNNAAEFKDLKVVSPDGTVLFQSDFSKNIDEWKKIGNGEWSVHDNVLRQSAIAPNITAFIGDTSWTDYTITLQARKLSGENGFQIYFHNMTVADRIRWDLGGYNNSVYLMEMGLASESQSAGIEPGRWYDIRIEVKGGSVKGYLDGKLTQEAGDSRSNVKCLCASAVRDDRSGDLIVKIVNADARALSTTIDLKGANGLPHQANATVLTSESPLDENTLENPTKVSPKTERVELSGTTITRTFPGNSLTVIRIPKKK
ncbi:MAG TPA: alpha-L-arabinofuranosidase C-terminal domain-containing protein, partial [Bacteroidota bacterium]|nr:alpha-L-arabinofuranosidase C-terminal domain-containing protein [Bacteroidota bacterium]